MPRSREYWALRTQGLCTQGCGRRTKRCKCEPCQRKDNAKKRWKTRQARLKLMKKTALEARERA